MATSNLSGYTGWDSVAANADYASKHGGQAPSGMGSGNGPLDTQFKGFSDEINKYTDELIGQAKGNYDFAAKWIENNYKQALGSDDQERAQFLKSVANAMEAKVGRIEFDHNTGVYRANQQANTSTQRVTEDRTQALQRLDQDQQILQQQAAVENANTRAQTGDNLNSRGLVNGSYNSTTGLGGKVIGQTEQGINDKMGALQRAYDRNTNDINLGANRNLTDINTGLTNTLQDLNTTARRGAEDQQMSHDYGLDSAARTRDTAIQGFNAQRYGQQNQLQAMYADQLTKQKLGY